MMILDKIHDISPSDHIQKEVTLVTPQHRTPAPSTPRYISLVRQSPLILFKTKTVTPPCPNVFHAPSLSKWVSEVRKEGKYEIKNGSIKQALAKLSRLLRRVACYSTSAHFWES
jgi:hypothetical protein